MFLSILKEINWRNWWGLRELFPGSQLLAEASA